MIPNDETQYASLIISVIVFLSMIVLFKNRSSARIFYFSMMVGWVLGIVYYIVVLFFNQEIIKDFNFSISHLSAQLRLVQYLIFGTWFILDALDISIKHIRQKIQKIKIDKRLEDAVIDWNGESYE